MNTSFAEKSAWITLIGLLVVFTGYFAVAAPMLASGVTAMLPFLPLLGVAVVLLVTLLVLGHVVAAVVGHADDGDERDRQIAWRAEAGSSWVLGVGVLAAIFGLAAPIGRAWIANGLLLFLFLAEVLNYGLQVYHYRRGL